MTTRRVLPIAGLIVLIAVITIAVGVHLGYWRTVRCTHPPGSQLKGCPTGNLPPAEESYFSLN